MLESSLQKIFLIPKITMEKTRGLVKRVCTRVKTHREPDIMTIKSFFFSVSLCYLYGMQKLRHLLKKQKSVKLLQASLTFSTNASFAHLYAFFFSILTGLYSF